MHGNSQAENHNFTQNEQKDPFFPKGFAKVDHNSINIRELLQPYKDRKEAVPESLARLHLDFELNAGTLKKRSRHYFVTCWNWGWRRVKKLLEDRQISAKLLPNSCQTFAKQKSSVSGAYRQHAPNNCQKTAKQLPKNRQQIKERIRIEQESITLRACAREQQNENQTDEFSFEEAWKKYPGLIRAKNEPASKGSKKTAKAKWEKLVKAGKGKFLLRALEGAINFNDASESNWLPQMTNWLSGDKWETHIPWAEKKKKSQFGYERQDLKPGEEPTEEVGDDEL